MKNSQSKIKAPRSALARLSDKSGQRERKNERGSALVYILIAIALLAALTVTFMEPSSQQTSSQAGFRTATELNSQVRDIRSAVQECVLRYGRGDNTITATPSESSANIVYPINPNSSHLPAALQSGDRNVSGLRCPGNNAGGAANNHQPIWTAGKFMPPPPDLFEEWQWYNGVDGVFFWTRTTKSDSFLQSALEKIDDNFSECEADIIVAGGSAVDMDSDATSQASCPANNTCFRIWMINRSTAPHGDYAVDNSCGSSDI